MAYTALVAVFLLLAVTGRDIHVTCEFNSKSIFIIVNVKSQDPADGDIVQCRINTYCSSGGEESTFEECCSHFLDPPGVAYTIDGGEGCRACPIGMYHNSQHSYNIVGNFL